MKKLKVTLLALGLSIGVISAQSSGSTTAPAQKSTKAAKPTATTTATPAKPAQHLKKDGTPDMRYKENKAAAGKTTTPKKAATPAATQPTSSNSGK